ncbi:hypothetical protein ColKHC_14052 [Colletotrichum higginsianum]|nr:hypothetical protein ColKHC_14052 [Colletotrichum higginsianum]
MSTGTVTQKAMMSAGLSGRITTITNNITCTTQPRGSPPSPLRTSHHPQDLVFVFVFIFILVEAVPLHPLATLVAVVFDFFLRGVLDLTRPPRELVGLFVRGVFTSLCWAYHALPMPVAMGMFYYGFQSVPDGLRSVEELRVVHSSRPDAGAMAGGASGIDGLYGLGELAVVRWGDLGLVSAFYCLSMMTAAYAVMVLMELRDYILDTWALIVDEALEVKALLRADDV